RRNQKVIEEAPSPFLDEKTRKAMGEQSVALAMAVDYSSAGTVEFIVDGDQNFYFLEMNTRLQVEHPVTELITGIDLVEQMIRVAYGEELAIKQEDVKLNGWAMECRLYAEDPYRNFLPSIGRLTRYRPPEEGSKDGIIVRNDTGVYEGGEISMYYDPMIAKLCTWGKDRATAIAGMRTALDTFEVEGIGHNLPFLSAVMDHERFYTGNITTAFIEEEYPEGFEGASTSSDDKRKLAALAASINMIAQLRRTRISGAMANHKRRVGKNWVVSLTDKDGSENFPLKMKTKNEGAKIQFADGAKMKVLTDWRPGTQLVIANIDGEPIAVKISSTAGGYQLRYRGATLEAQIMSPVLSALNGLMIEKTPADTSKQLLCPMPGLIVSIAVSEGDEVHEGQALATVEAMKMENILRAEKKTKVIKINATAGESLAVDEIIMEFE
ncbi:MAG: biotin/lipoyl-containing protein, partial [Rhizobiaceae bacterium]